MWQTWQVASLEAVVWKWVKEAVVSATTATTIATASDRPTSFFDDIANTVGDTPGQGL